MENKRLFPCKEEEVTAIGEFLRHSLQTDWDDFAGYSPVFTTGFMESLEAKIAACREVVGSSVVTKELKSATARLTTLSDMLRVKLNALEGYLKLSAAELDIPVADFGLKNVRNAISRGNTESLMTETAKMSAAVKRNRAALESKGLQPELTAEIESRIGEIDALNVRQNDLISARNRLTEQNIHLFNDLWTALQPILNTAKAIYGIVDKTKLKDYTVTQLIKRIHSEGGRRGKEKATAIPVDRATSTD